MKLAVALCLLAGTLAHAGVIRTSVKVAKKAVHYTHKAGKVAYKVAY